MVHSTSTIVRIEESKGEIPLSSAQKSFNRLIAKIDKQRAQLASWQSAIALYQQKRAGEFDPLLRTFSQLRGKLVELLDRAYPDKAMNKSDKSKLKNIICLVAEELVVESGDDKLKSIYNKYGKTDFDAQAAEANDACKSMIEEMFGVEIGGDIDLSSPEQVLRQLAEKMHQQQAQQEENRQDHQQDTPPKYQERHRTQKKSAKELAKEAKQQEEAQNISQSIREVFRKLASALHPDREQDPVERDRKTALMQSVNAAYRSKDLLKLLELQLEVEQIDQSMINSISEDRLKHYNKVLSGQSQELQDEIKCVEYAFQMRFGFPPYGSLSPATAMRQLQDDIKQVQYDIAMLEKDLVSFQSIKNLKNWLKSYRISRRRPQFEEDMFDDIAFGAMFNEYA
jgi:hypothetical protein